MRARIGGQSEIKYVLGRPFASIFTINFYSLPPVLICRDATKKKNDRFTFYKIFAAIRNEFFHLQLVKIVSKDDRKTVAFFHFVHVGIFWKNILKSALFNDLRIDRIVKVGNKNIVGRITRIIF